MPRTTLLARDKAVGQTRHVFPPSWVVQHGKNEFGGIGVAALHQPPPVVIALGAKNHLGALV